MNDKPSSIPLDDTPLPGQTAPAVAPRQSASKGRVVSIIGRPNVGKSALFNRIAGQRVAIVHDQSGVTRDRLVREITWQGERLLLVDTGGINEPQGKQSGDVIAEGTRRQVDIALQDAALCILVADVQEGLHPLDEAVARLVRRAAVPCLLAVNKVDLPQHETGAGEFARLGLPTFTVSAAHGRGFSELMERTLALLPPATPADEIAPLRVAVVGRPNAGKSSYINKLLRSERVIVSDIPGTTRDSIEVPFTIGDSAQARHYTLIDTAGLKHVHSVTSPVERFSLFRTEQSIADADIVVLMMDSETGPTLQDKHIAAKIMAAQKGCVLVANKWDILKERGALQKQVASEFMAQINFMSYCPLVFMSAKSGYNVRQSIETIDAVAAQVRLKLPTGLLNRVLESACRQIQMPTTGRKQLKVFYATQTGVAPLRVRIFVNDTKLVKKNFIDFLERKTREHFGLEGAPLVLSFQERSRPDSVEKRARHSASRSK